MQITNSKKRIATLAAVILVIVVVVSVSIYALSRPKSEFLAKINESAIAGDFTVTVKHSFGDKACAFILVTVEKSDGGVLPYNVMNELFFKINTDASFSYYRVDDGGAEQAYLVRINSIDNSKKMNGRKVNNFNPSSTLYDPLRPENAVLLPKGEPKFTFRLNYLPFRKTVAVDNLDGVKEMNLYAGAVYFDFHDDEGRASMPQSISVITASGETVNSLGSNAGSSPKFSSTIYYRFDDEIDLTTITDVLVSGVSIHVE